MAGSPGGANRVTLFPSNVPPFVSDAVIDSNLLTASTAKTIPIKYWDGTNAVAQSLMINNFSGQACTVLLQVSPTAAPGGALNSGNAIYIPSGGSIQIDAAVGVITETNIGSGTQTGRGVQYIATLIGRTR